VGHLSRYVTSHPGQLSLAIHSWVGAVSTSQRAVTPCGWGVKAGMVSVWVAGKVCHPIVAHGPYLSALGMVLPHNKALYKSPDYFRLLSGQFRTNFVLWRQSGPFSILLTYDLPLKFYKYTTFWQSKIVHTPNLNHFCLISLLINSSFGSVVFFLISLFRTLSVAKTLSNNPHHPHSRGNTATFIPFTAVLPRLPWYYHSPHPHASL